MCSAWPSSSETMQANWQEEVAQAEAKLRQLEADLAAAEARANLAKSRSGPAAGAPARELHANFADEMEARSVAEPSPNQLDCAGGAIPKKPDAFRVETTHVRESATGDDGCQKQQDTHAKKRTKACARPPALRGSIKFATGSKEVQGCAAAIAEEDKDAAQLLWPYEDEAAAAQLRQGAEPIASDRCKGRGVVDTTGAHLGRLRRRPRILRLRAEYRTATVTRKRTRSDEMKLRAVPSAPTLNTCMFVSF